MRQRAYHRLAASPPMNHERDISHLIRHLFTSDTFLRTGMLVLSSGRWILEQKLRIGTHGSIMLRFISNYERKLARYSNEVLYQ